MPLQAQETEGIYGYRAGERVISQCVDYAANPSSASDTVWDLRRVRELEQSRMRVQLFWGSAIKNIEP